MPPLELPVGLVDKFILYFDPFLDDIDRHYLGGERSLDSLNYGQEFAKSIPVVHDRVLDCEHPAVCGRDHVDIGIETVVAANGELGAGREGVKSRIQCDLSA